MIEEKKKKPVVVEQFIDFNASEFRPSTSPIKKHLPELRRTNALSNMFQESKSTKLPVLRSNSSRKIRPPKSAQHRVEQNSNLDTLYRIALQNQAACKSIDQSHIEKRKTIDRDFASQHRAMKATVRLAACA